VGNPPRRSGCLIAFSLAFTGLSGLFVFVFGSEAAHSLRIRWTYRETTCTLLERRAKEHPGKPTSFSPEADFEHRAAGQAVTCTGFDGRNLLYPRQKVEALLAPFEVGETYPCWYDPGDPSRAVLVRGLQAGSVLALLLVLGFFGAGATLLFYSLRPGGMESPPSAGAVLALSLEPRGGRNAGPLLTVSFCVPWAAAPALMLTGGWWETDARHLAFLAVFGALGTLAVAAVACVAVHWIRIGGTRVEISRSPLSAGEEARYRVRHRPRLGLVEGMEILLLGERTEGSGRRRRETTLHSEALDGSEGILRIPEDALPSGALGDAEIQRTLRVTARYRRSPRFVVDFPLAVSASRNR
jgi:hypothetical protein